MTPFRIAAHRRSRANCSSRFNLDPVLLVALAIATVLHLAFLGRSGQSRRSAFAGWGVTTFALVSPLCALSVALFSARVAQHMVLILVAAPLLARTWPSRRRRFAPPAMWASAVGFAVLLWLWHMPGPYAATFHSTLVYWTMHVTLFGSAVVLWMTLMHHAPADAPPALAVGAVTSVQMGFLGAILTFAGHPLFAPHALTTFSWGFSPLLDQQLGGALMWVPGIFLFVAVLLRSATIAWSGARKIAT